MSFIDKDTANRLKQVTGQPQPTPASDANHNIDQYFILRARMLGVLIRDARMKASRIEADCAHVVGVSQATFSNWEFGDESPTLPQLEVLANFLNIPISHFWSQKTLVNDSNTSITQTQHTYFEIRDRMIGLMLRQAREQANLSVAELAHESGVDAQIIAQYELGELPIPMHHLNALANEVNKNISYFLDYSGQVGELLAIQEQWKHFSQLPEDVRAFAANPVNVGFIEIAVMLSKMPTDKLRSVGASIVDITM
ncbi:MAG: helix-turn-helix domain-containing protein [Phototrophicaceae bacterium]